MSVTTTTKQSLRSRRHARVRSKVVGTKDRPRLVVYKTNKFVSVQLIDDGVAMTLASAHGREFGGAKSVQAESVGKAISERAKKIGVTSVVFDRGGYAYVACVKTLADAARSAGLTF